MRDLERQRDIIQGELHLLNTEKGAWLRVEQGLKDKIHALQQEYYQGHLRHQGSIGKEMQLEVVSAEGANQQSTLLEVKLDGLQAALETLEGRFELKEQEVQYLNQLVQQLE